MSKCFVTSIHEATSICIIAMFVQCLRLLLQVRELGELKKAHGKRQERLKTVQENYRNVKEQLRTLEEEYYG